MSQDDLPTNIYEYIRVVLDIWESQRNKEKDNGQSNKVGGVVSE